MASNKLQSHLRLIRLHARLGRRPTSRFTLPTDCWV